MAVIATPVTIVTGFLGSGKTTLINRILKAHHGVRYAVIENEYGEAAVDAELLVRSGNETIVVLDNGCLCCTVRGDLAKALGKLSERKAAGEIAYDWVLIETTGLADPGPVIQTFLAETALLTQFYLDGVVTLVDAVHLAAQSERLEVRAQIAYADRILLTKIDLVDTGQREAARERIQRMNPQAVVRELAVNDQDLVALSTELFEIRGYQFDRVRFAPAAPRDFSMSAPRHTTDIVSFAYRSEQPLDRERLQAFFDAAQARYSSDLWRYKGVLNIDKVHQRVVIQGVQGLLQQNYGGNWRPFEKRENLLVFIGRALDGESLLQQLRDCELRTHA